MDDNIKYLERQIQNAQSNAEGARRQAEVEHNTAIQYDAENREGDSDYHNQQAAILEQRAAEFEDEIQRYESKRVEVEARIADLKGQRETLNRETVDKITAIDNELARLQGSMTI